MWYNEHVMRNLEKKLFFDAMPGRYRALDVWKRDMATHEIDVVVCLTSDHEITEKSPDYAELRAQAEQSPDSTKLTVEDRPVKVIDFPIEDFSAPAPQHVTEFWDLAAQIAQEMNAGHRVFIHCGAGIGRTGTMAVAALMQQGIPREEALRQVEAAGSGPENPTQHELLKGGAPSSSGTS